MTDVKSKKAKTKGPEVDDLIFGTVFKLKDIKATEPSNTRSRTPRNVSLRTTERKTRPKPEVKDSIGKLSRIALEKKYRDQLTRNKLLADDVTEYKRLYRRCQILVDNFDTAIMKYKKSPLT